MSSRNVSAADFGSETESDSDTSPQSCTAGSNDNIGASKPLQRNGVRAHFSACSPFRPVLQRA
eukprot:CAMPEP_0179450824 /NCGR_PEP_ID=MMETSP0799-20121207/34803_1 /TAXON_ID=46947 /ORGANISM="Geminigera cryophila, Strain CCMP2564" /LENGTH=62 /DNA_ID=CAMNT_0021245319 /DNA_START=153 /DNA_END=338 /DNA_ORIENTATION=-